MTAQEALLTMLGGFILPFCALLFWGRLVDKWRAWGGFLAAALIVGPIWLLNHGLPSPLIKQSGLVFIDMGLATAIGILVFGLLQGRSFKKTLPIILSCSIGASLAGLLLSMLF
ncbi:Lin0368 family putative glycerol transporter subunit [Streptococcus caprae]|uniref:Lin0368 family putative glycerol transporter subunit n=1 Tax=Streptococcus caprae TaxID=1640501 RepID=A0ABV8CY10_9STRE